MFIKINYKFFNKIFVIVYISTCLINPCYGGKINSQYEEILSRFETKLNCTRETAIKIFHIINLFTDSIQNALARLASSDISKINYTKYIDQTIKQYFESDKATVQVSNLRDNTIKTYSIKDYLYSIVNLKKKYKTTKIELSYYSGYLGISHLTKISTTKYELSVSMWQTFRGYFGDYNIYSDATKKQFSLIINLDNNKISIAVSHITVLETNNYEFEKDIWQRTRNQ